MPFAHRTAPLQAALAAAALGAIGGADANKLSADDGHGPTIIAIWRIERLDFIYRSTNVYYSCDSLQRKIGKILRALGAHKRIVIDVECSGDEMVNNAYAHISLAIPAEATPENVRAATTYDERTQLVAKLRRMKLPTDTELLRFPAQRRTISLTRSRAVGLESGDCDLLRELSAQVFPKLGMYVEGDGLTCLRGGASRIRPRIEVSALMPVQADTRGASG